MNNNDNKDKIYKINYLYENYGQYIKFKNINEIINLIEEWNQNNI